MDWVCVHGRVLAEAVSNISVQSGPAADNDRGGHPDRPTKDLLMSLVPSVPITTFLIDDGWQDVTITKLPNRTRRRLKSFHPWDQLGASMTDVVSSLKKTGIKEVGVWLTLQGYWEGIDPDSELVQKYDCKPHNMESPSDDQDNQLWLPRPDRAAAFWRDWFTEMKSWGIGFVKVSETVVCRCDANTTTGG